MSVRTVIPTGAIIVILSSRPKRMDRAAIHSRSGEPSLSLPKGTLRSLPKLNSGKVFVEERRFSAAFKVEDTGL